MIKRLLGLENISSLGLNELGDRFKTAEIAGKMANLGDDISKEYIKDNSVFKKLATGERVMVERKGHDPFSFESYAKLIFSANEIPRINDHSDGLKRRLILIPFNARFSKNDPDYDPFIIDKLMQPKAMEYLLKISLTALSRLLGNNAFTSNEALNQALFEYEKMNNPLIEYLDELEEDQLENESIAHCYRIYSTWSNENGVKAVSKTKFSKEVCIKFDMKSKPKKIKGKTQRVFEKSED